MALLLVRRYAGTRMCLECVRKMKTCAFAGLSGGRARSKSNLICLPLMVQLEFNSIMFECRVFFWHINNKSIHSFHKVFFSPSIHIFMYLCIYFASFYYSATFYRMIFLNKKEAMWKRKKSPDFYDKYFAAGAAADVVCVLLEHLINQTL